MSHPAHLKFLKRSQGGDGRAAKAHAGRRQRFASAVGGVPPTALRCSVMRPVAELTPLASPRYVQTGGDKSVHERAARGAACPALLAAEEARCHLPARAFAATFVVLGGTANAVAVRERALAFRGVFPTVAARQAVFVGRGDFWGFDPRSPEVGRACALQELTRRGCLSGMSKANEASSAAPTSCRAPQRSRCTRRPTQHEPLPNTACRAEQTLRKSGIATDTKKNH